MQIKDVVISLVFVPPSPDNLLVCRTPRPSPPVPVSPCFLAVLVRERQRETRATTCGRNIENIYREVNESTDVSRSRLRGGGQEARRGRDKLCPREEQGSKTKFTGRK